MKQRQFKGTPKAVLVRMPEALHQKLEREAHRRGISLNWLVVELLETGIRPRTGQRVSKK